MKNRILEDFLETVSSSANRLALSDAKNSMTFSELHERVSAYAIRLKHLRAKHGFIGLTPILVERDLDSACLVLACLMYDIPFSPIDVDWTKERLEFVDGALGTPPFWISVGQEGNSVLSKTGIAPRLMGLQENKFEVEHQDLIPSAVAEDCLSYVIFTSGTTGKPKGVMYNLSGMNGKYESKREKLRESSDQPVQSLRIGHCYPFHFSAGLWILANLANGAYLRIFSSEELGVSNLIKIVNDERINRLALPPSLIYLLANLDNNQSETNLLMPGVDEVTFGGDAVSFSTVKKLKKFFRPDSVFQTGYGASEVAAWVYFSFKFEDAPAGGPIPLGTLEQARDIKLVDSAEDSGYTTIHLAGPQAAGYLGEEQLTTEKFYTAADGQRWWRSGDLVHVDNLGYIWHKGRVDDLVKIRGKLTSPSEASRVLFSIEGVLDAVVLPRHEGSQTQLVAHIQLERGSPITATEIRRQLSKALPPHLVPSRIMNHESLPKNSRGKPNREILKNIEIVDFIDRRIYKPINVFEARVLAAVKSVLDTRELSVDDDLSLYGLDSLASLEVEMRLKDDFPQISYDLIMTNNTVEKISHQLKIKASFSELKEFAYNADGNSPPIHAFPGGDGLRYSHFAHLAKELGADQPLIVYRHSMTDVSDENTTIQGQARHVFNSLPKDSGSGSVCIVGYSGGGAQALQLARLCLDAGMTVSLNLIDTIPQSVNLGIRGSKIGATLAKTRKKGKSTLQLILDSLKSGLKNQGLLRSSRVVLFERIPTLMLSIDVIKQMTRKLITLVPKMQHNKLSASLVPILIWISRSNFRPEPMSLEEQKKIFTLYFYSPKNSEFQVWKSIIPNITFVSSEGDHISMVRPPHIEPIAKLISDSKTFVPN